MLRHLVLSSYPGLDKQPESQDREYTTSKSSADSGGAEGAAPAKALEPDTLGRQLNCSTDWPQDILAPMQSRVMHNKAGQSAWYSLPQGHISSK